MGTVYEIYKLKFTIKEIPIIFRDRIQKFQNLRFLEQKM